MTPAPVIDIGADTGTADVGSDAAFDAILDGDSSSTATEGDTDVNDGPDAEPDPEPVVEPEPEPEPEVVDPNVDGADIRKSANGKGYSVRPEKLNRLIASEKFAQQLQQIVPTVEHAQALQADAGEYRHMRSDFSGADPNDLTAWTDFWAAESPQAFPAAATSMVEKLRQVSPETYTSLQDSMVSNHVESLYQKAADTGDADDLYRAQMADWSKSGQYREKTNLPKVDPAKREREAFEKRQQDFNSKVQKTHDGYWSRVDSNIKADRDNAVNGLIQKALEPAKGKFAADQLDAFAFKIRAELDNTLQSDFAFDRNQKLDYREIERSVRSALKADSKVNVTPQVKAYIDTLTSRADPVIRQIATRIVSNAAKTAVQQNQQTRDKLQGSQKRGAAGGAPARPAAAGNAKNFDQAFADVWK